MSLEPQSIYTKEYYERTGLIETAFAQTNVLRPDQASAFVYMYLNGHKPGVILSIGCGTGLLEQFIEQQEPDIRVIGTDISKAVAGLYKGKEFHRAGCQQATNQFCDVADTIIMCESLEHIGKVALNHFLTIMQKHQYRRRLIITNRLEYWPITVNGWDHIMRVDKAVFNIISEIGTVIFRHGSHLVLDIEGAQ